MAMPMSMSDDHRLQIMQLRTKVLEVSLQAASVGAIKNPREYCEENWAWVADVGQPETASQKRSRPRSQDNATSALLTAGKTAV